MSNVSPETHHLGIARRYLAAIERGDADAVAQVLHADVVQEEFPNRLTQQTARRDRAGLLTSFERGLQILSSQTYEVVSELAAGDRVVLEVLWSGTLKVAFGDALPAGSVMRARFAVFLDFRDGLIVAQRNYDCFEPW